MMSNCPEELGRQIPVLRHTVLKTGNAQKAYETIEADPKEAVALRTQAVTVITQWQRAAPGDHGKMPRAEYIIAVHLLAHRPL
jgi:hypothetical protein